MEIYLIAQNIKLNNGNNTFKIIGKNDSGTDEDQTTIVYNNNTSPKPVVDITVPSVNPDATNNNTINISFSIFNVLSKNDMCYFNNIKKILNFYLMEINFKHIILA